MNSPLEIQQLLSGTDSVPRGILSRRHDQFLGKADHALKGLLRDKGKRGHSIDEMIKLHQRAIAKVDAACDALVKLVRDKNKDMDGGLLNLKYNGRHIFQWRANGKIAQATNGKIVRTATVQPFNMEFDDYGVVDQALREHSSDLKHFYRAADNVAQELAVRHQMLSSNLRALETHLERGAKSTVISPRADKVSEEMFDHVWKAVEEQKTF